MFSDRDGDGGDRFVGSVSKANDVPTCCRDGSGDWMHHLRAHKRKTFLDSLKLLFSIIGHSSLMEKRVESALKFDVCVH